MEPVEVEVKLGVERPRVVSRLLRHPDPTRLAGFEADGEAHVVRVTDRYLDTDPTNGNLFARALRARLRRRGSGVVLTVKRAGVIRDAVTTRVELEGPATPSLDPTHWPASDARSVLLDAAGGIELIEIARLRQRRLTRRVRRAAMVVEASLDRLEALDRGRVLAVRHELEAELLEGDAAALGELAAALLELDGVGPPTSSKLWFALEARAASRGERVSPGGELGGAPQPGRSIPSRC